MSTELNNMQTLNYDRQSNFIMKSDEASKRSLQTWSTVTEEINQAFGRVLSERYKEDEQITLTACEQWYNQLESILKDIENPVHYYDEYMRKIGEITRKLKSDAQKPNPEPSPHNQPLMLMPAPVQLGQNNFSLWLNSLKMKLCALCAVQAVESALPEENPLNLIARGLILQTVELQTPIKQLKVAYEMLQVLRHEYEKNDEHSQSSTSNNVKTPLHTKRFSSFYVTNKLAHENASTLQSTVANQHTGNKYNDVVFSDLHQASLPGAQLKGNQCTFMSLTAIIYSTLIKSFPQSKNDMFQILKCGNSYYESNMKKILESHPMFFSCKQPSFHTGPGDIRLKNVKIFGKKVVVRTGEEVMAVGLFDNEVRGLKNIGDALKEFLDERLNTAALVICGHSSRAIMKRTYDEISKYYLFDSHEFDSKTAFQLQHSLVGDRNAAFVVFDSADSLICTYKNLVYKFNPRIQLDLTEIVCETNENGDANNFFDIDNYNPSDNVNLEEKLTRRFDQHKQKLDSKDN